MGSKARTGAIVGAVVIVLAVVLIGFVATVQSTVISTTENTFETSSAYLVTITQTSTSTQPAFSGTDESLKPNTYDYMTASLVAGTVVQVSWTASDTVNVYAFNSAQFSAYSSSTTVTSAGSSSSLTNWFWKYRNLAVRST